MSNKRPVLIVDDDATMLEMLSEHLDATGEFVATTAATACFIATPTATITMVRTPASGACGGRCPS